MRKWLLVLGIASALVLWRYWGSVPIDACVGQSIATMQLAMGPSSRQVVAGNVAGDSFSLAGQGAAKAFVACGPGAISVLIKQLQRGERPRRLAMQALLLEAGKHKPFAEQLRGAMWRLMEHQDWRMREVAMTVLWKHEYRPAERARLVSMALGDAHAFLRYLGARVSRHQTPAEKPLRALLALFRKGVVGRHAPTSGDHDHFKHHDHAHAHTGSDPQLDGGVEKWLRGRSSCRIDSDDDWPARKLIADSLALWKLPIHQKVRLWLHALQDRHASVRKAARAQIIGQGKKALPALRLTMLEAPVPRKHQVAHLLAAMGSDASQVLLAMFARPQPAIWHAAARGLKQAKALSTKQVDVLCQRLQGSPRRRLASAEILAMAGGPGHQCLVREMASHNLEVRLAATRGAGLASRQLCHPKPDSAHCLALARLLQSVLSWRSIQEVPAQLQAEALWALGQLGSAAQGYREALLQGLGSVQQRPSQVQQAWLTALLLVGQHHRNVRTALHTWLANEAHPTAARVSLLRVWAQQPTISLPSMKALLVGLRSSQRLVRVATRDVLAAHPTHHGALLPMLLAGLQDPRAEIRAATALALARWKQWPAPHAQACATALTRASLSDPSPAVQQAAASGLFQMGRLSKGHVSLAQWRSLLHHRQWQIRMKAARTLAKSPIDTDFSVKQLIIALRDTKRQVRRAAASALGAFGKAAKSAEAGLQKAIGDHAIDVQHAAKRALAMIRSAQR